VEDKFFKDVINHVEPNPLLLEKDLYKIIRVSYLRNMEVDPKFLKNLLKMWLADEKPQFPTSYALLVIQYISAQKDMKE
jgi:hypothetical protein